MNDIRIYPELVKTHPEAGLMSNLDPEHAVLGTEKPHSIPVDREVQALKVFIEGIENLYEEDYGDFMREVNSHLLDLIDQLHTAPKPLREKLTAIQNYLQFNPTWEIEPTRQKLLSDAYQILKEEQSALPLQVDP